MKKRILVLLSAYNGERFIRPQIESILNQKTGNDIFLKIRDDGSNDCTCKIIENLQKEYPGQIELIKGTNIGCNASFFYLLKTAEEYDYYAISDQDDIWISDKLETAVNWLEAIKDDIPLLYSSTSYLVKNNLIPYGTTRKKERSFTIYNTIIQNICPGHGQVMNKKLLNLLRNNIDISKIYVYDTWITNMAMLYGKIIFNNRPYTLYRLHGDNQLGYGFGRFGQMISSAKRSVNGDGRKYMIQIRYFIDQNKVELERQGYLKELVRFVRSDSFWKRIKYTMNGKVYRQSKVETVAFYICYIIGKF